MKTALTTLRRTVLIVGLATCTLAPMTAHADIYMQSPRGSNDRLDEGGGAGAAVGAVIDWLASLFG